MQEAPKTPCECPLAGFCNRHGVEKSSHLHKLCQNHPGYFNMWEECRGPNQNPNDCIKPNPVRDNVEPQETINPPEGVKLPSKLEMAKNFVKAAAQHVANGMADASPALQESRMEICMGCPFITEDKSRCGHCGCFLASKTKWQSSSCPIGKW